VRVLVNVLASPILDDARDLIIDGLNRVRLPTIYQWPELAELGGFAGYGPRLSDVIRDAIGIVEILRGAHASDIPVEQPSRFEFVINLKAAKRLGLDIPPALIALADQIIEGGKRGHADSALVIALLVETPNEPGW
jgi:putative ABC transport system substrate-binding protein